VESFSEQLLVQHELRKRIFRRFKQEGIAVPVVERTVLSTREKT
jgi:small-conductance mechanosensitive channel